MINDRGWRVLFSTRKFSPPTGGFFLAPAEGQGPSGPKGYFSRQTDNGFKGVRLMIGNGG